MFFIKGISMLISFLYVPLLYNTLSVDSYGVWLSLTSLVSWISMFDVGLGHGLRNKLARALATDDVLLARKYVATAYGCITAIVAAIILLFACVESFVPWANVLNAGDVDVSELNVLVVVVFVAFCANFLLNIINSILYALQQPAISSLISMMSQLLSYIVVLILVKFYAVSSLLLLGTIISVIPVVVVLISTIVIFRRKYRDIAPSTKYFDASLIRNILSLGGQFFIIQIVTLVLYQTNNLIITHTVGNEAVVEYNIAYKYMHILILVFNIIATPLWSATTDAYARGDFDWIKSTNKKLRKIVVLMALGGLVMLCGSPIAYKVWLGEESSVRVITTALLYLYSLAMMMYGSYGYILNGIGKLRVQLIATLALAILYVPISVCAGKIAGLTGILLVFFLTTLANYIWSKIQFKKLMNHTAVGVWAK